MNPSRKRFICFFVGAALAAASIGAKAFAQSAVALDVGHPSVRAVIAVQNDVTPGWMNTAAVLGTAVGIDGEQPVLLVYVDRNNAAAASTIAALPTAVRGTRVRVELTEKFRALVGKPGSSGGGTTPISHKAKQSGAIELGTSGGWAKDLANGYCCGGTLGALIQVGTKKYVLSNYHVLEADIVNGGNGTTATTGDAVIHPALIDVNCNAANARTVATLRTLSSLPNSNVDCAIAEVISGEVSTTGNILEIGTLSSTTVGAALRQAVKKSGRTTGLTRSAVSGLNATIRVTYDEECAGGTAFTHTFTGQIVIANKGSKFLAGGDSGSCMVEDVPTNPRAIGLLYAGSSTSAIANPINEVLTFIGTGLGGTATMVGQ